MPSLYRHYKNKPYRVLGEARHSETLESLVLYEACYENEMGKIWVRPKEMFFSTVEVGERTVARFAAAKIEYRESDGVSETEERDILALLQQVFGEYPRDKFRAKLADRKRVLLVSAYEADRLVGFKLGYEMSADRFYSWLGAVGREYRGFGIGKELLAKQHEWCRQNKYRVVETRTRNKWREMLILNLQNGFEIVGVSKDAPPEQDILLEKRI